MSAVDLPLTSLAGDVQPIRQTVARIDACAPGTGLQNEFLAGRVRGISYPLEEIDCGEPFFTGQSHAW